MKLNLRSQKNFALLTTLGALSIVSIACGGKKDKEKATAEEPAKGTIAGNPSTTSSSHSEGEETAMTSDHLDEAADALGDGDVSTSTALSLDGNGPAKNQSLCTANADGSVLVERDFARSLDVSLSFRSKSRSYSASVDFTHDLVWKKEGVSLACNPSGKHAQLDWKDSALISGLEGTLSFNRKFDREMTDGKGNSKKLSFEAIGTRSIKFLSQENSSDAANIIRVKEVTSDVVRKGTRDLSINGEIKNKSMEHSVKIEAAAPLKIKVTRDASTKAWKEKLIESGIVKSELVGVRKVSTEFTNLLFKKSEEACTPVSGKLVSTISAPDGTFRHKYIVEFKELEGVSSATLSKCLMVDGAEKCSQPADFPEASVRGCSLENE
jgi:hypothetical protein